MKLKYWIWITYVFIFSACTVNDDTSSLHNMNSHNPLRLEFSLLSRNGLSTPGMSEDKVSNIVVWGVGSDDVLPHIPSSPSPVSPSRFYNSSVYYFKFNNTDLRQENEKWRTYPWQTVNSLSKLFLTANFSLDVLPQNNVSDINSLNRVYISNADISDFVSKTNGIAMTTDSVSHDLNIIQRKKYDEVNNGSTSADNVFSFELRRMVAKAIVRFSDNNTTNENGFLIRMKDGTPIATLKNFQYMPCNMSKGTYLVQQLDSNQKPFDLVMYDNNQHGMTANLSNDNYLKQPQNVQSSFCYGPRSVEEHVGNIDAHELAGTEKGCYFFENIEPDEIIKPSKHITNLYWGNVTYITVVAEFEPKLDRVWIRQKKDSDVSGNLGNFDDGVFLESVLVTNTLIPTRSERTRSDGNNTVTIGGSAGDEWKHPESIAKLRSMISHNNGIIYYGLKDNYFYVTEDDAKTYTERIVADDGKVTYQHNDLDQPYVKYKDFKCGYRVIPNPVPYDRSKIVDYKIGSNPVIRANVLRNDAYILNLRGAYSLGFNYDGNNPNNPQLPSTDLGEQPSDGVTSATPINSSGDIKLNIDLQLLKWGKSEIVYDYYY